MIITQVLKKPILITNKNNNIEWSDLRNGTEFISSRNKCNVSTSISNGKTIQPERGEWQFRLPILFD